MTSYLLRGDFCENRKADAQTSYDSARSSGTRHHRAESLFITGNKTRDAALGEPRIIAGEIIGWRFWKLCDGFLHSVYVSHLWRPGAFERASCKEYGPENLGYHAFKIREQAEHQAIANIYDSIAIIGSVAMWGEVIEHERGWRSEYAAVRSIIKIIGDVSLLNKQCLLVELREKYRCPVVTEL